MTPFEAHQPDMDAQVRNHLGDSISVALKDGTTAALLGFVTLSADGVGTEGLTGVAQLWHVKIDKSAENVLALPDGPASIRRLTAAKAPGLWKPASDTIDDDGGAWLFDLQRAAA